MAENPMLDLAQTVMIERYGLDEQKYSIVSFSEGAKACTIKMSDGWIPVSASFPLSFLEFEKIKRMNADEKMATFILLQPKWDKVPHEMKELFDDVVDDFEKDVPQLRMKPMMSPGDTATLKLSGDEPELVVHGKDGDKVIKPTVKTAPKAKATAHKPELKPGIKPIRPTK